MSERHPAAFFADYVELCEQHDLVMVDDAGYPAFKVIPMTVEDRAKMQELIEDQLEGTGS